MFNLKIIGTGNYLPELVVTNEMMAEIVDTNDEWITSRTGISERRYTSGEPTWYMASSAARKALEISGLDPAELSVILVTTVTPDYFTPSISSIVQAEIGAEHAFCIDLNAACSGFVFALDMASRYLASPEIKNILIISAENLSKMANFSDRKTCVLFGDGASALICTRSESGEASALLSTVLGSEGKNAQALVTRALPVGHPFIKPEAVWPDRYGQHDNHLIYMEGQEVFKFAVRVMADSIMEAARKANVEIADLSFIIPHQANARIVDAAARRMKAKPHQLVSRIAKYGNTSSASIPICLDEIIRSGQLKRGEKVAVCGFGGGLSYGAAIFVY